MKAVIFDFNRTLYNPDKKTLIDGALEVLTYLHGKKKLAIVAKKSEERFSVLKSLGIEKFFEKIIMEEEKNEEVFKKCIESLGVMPKDVIIVGDRIKKEITIGNKLGCVTLWFRNGKFKDEVSSSKEEEPKYVIKDLRELLKIVK